MVNSVFHVASSSCKPANQYNDQEEATQVQLVQHAADDQTCSTHNVKRYTIETFFQSIGHKVLDIKPKIQGSNLTLKWSTRPQLFEPLNLFSNHQEAHKSWSPWICLFLFFFPKHALSFSTHKKYNFIGNKLWSNCRSQSFPHLSRQFALKKKLKNEIKIK